MSERDPRTEPKPGDYSLSADALAVLVVMASGVELAYENGSGYLGHRRVKNGSQILKELHRSMAIRRVEIGGSTTEYYRIGETGREILAATVIKRGEA